MIQVKHPQASKLSDYDGLNLAQLLDLLKDPVVPDPVSFLPQTTGWWIVLAWLVAVLLILTWGGLRRWKRNRYRREALKTLRSIEKSGDRAVAGDIAMLLRRTALAAYPRPEVASLYGEGWAEFLKRTSRNDRLIRKSADDLASAAYRADVDASLLVKPARRWIQVHRA